MRDLVRSRGLGVVYKRRVQGLSAGQALHSPLLGRDIEVLVGGVGRAYARQFGAIVISATDYRALGGRFEATDLALWPRAGAGRALFNTRAVAGEM